MPPKSQKFDPRIQIVGKNIRYYRALKNMSQEKLAFESEISVAYISHAELGKANLTLFNLFKIADALQIEIIDLFDKIPQNKNFNSFFQ